MAVFAVKNMVDGHDGPKMIHPFFDKSSRAKQTQLKSNNDSHLQSTTSDGPNTFLKHSVAQFGPGNSTQESDPNIAAPARNTQSVHSNGTLLAQQGEETLDVDINQGRRKRRKTSSPGPIAAIEDLAEGVNYLTGHEAIHSQRNNTTSMEGDMASDNKTEEPKKSSDLESMTVMLKEEHKQDPPQIQPSEIPHDLSPKPRKMLRLNSKTGTIGPPPAKKESQPIAEVPSKSQQSKESRRRKSLIVKLSYGATPETRKRMGSKIEGVLMGSKAVQATCESRSASEKVTQNPKSTHPFFLGKAALKQAVPEVSPVVPKDIKKAGTNTSVKASYFPMMGKSVSSAPSSSTTGFLQLGNPSKVMKFPGAMEPMWPPREMTHVRGETIPLSVVIRDELPFELEQKSKYVATEPHVDEDILNLIAVRLKLAQVKTDLSSIDTDNFLEPEECLRIPNKHFESGINLQKRIRPELSVRKSLSSVSERVSSSEDELNKTETPKHRVHHAVSKLYDMIPASLSAFDRSQYETRSWIHKYAPMAAVEVLQSGREALILRDWLKGLTVMAVDTGNEDGTRSRGSSVTARRPMSSRSDTSQKRKRKSKKLDGFVISSDEEDEDMDEISEPEDDESPRGSQTLYKKTVMRAGGATSKSSKDASKTMNAVVISGPNGCGKTATVYAVAKELDFEVFEINSSSRRSGKDVLERVGDMTRNHLVHHSKPQERTISSQEEDLQRASESLNEDLKSGRQGTMNSFFKPVSSAKPKDSTKGRKQRGSKVILNKPTQQFSPKKAKPQKQSLILLEEVDILYEEDKQFWATVMTLIIQSRRPVIMTCNDEALLPLQSISLHAIIRLGPPPIDLAVDYLLLVAANEGHALKRAAIKSLYEAHNSDLRASMTELEFWCQIGVGDRRGGFEWFYPRLPAGIDRDRDGNTIRVVSEGTYETGMGWLSRDHLFESLEREMKHEEILEETWDGWRIDAAHWQESVQFGNWAAKVAKDINGEREAHNILSAYEMFVDSMSAADTCSWGGFAARNQVPLDTTYPALSVKVRDDFPLGYEVIDSDTPACYTGLATDISFALKTEALHSLQIKSSQILRKEQTQLNGPNEAKMISTIIDSQTCHHESIKRFDYSVAFDPIASSERSFIYAPTSLEPSCFDQPMAQVSTDVAPYIRSIVTYDAKLQQERARLSNLLSEGGRYGKRQRTTRSALSALEGGKRKTTRRERWFNEKLNPQLVLRTGLEVWQNALSTEMEQITVQSKGAKTNDYKTDEGNVTEGDDS